MQIKNNFQTGSSPQFKGINIAKSTNLIKNTETKIDLYQITPNDRTFLNKLRNTIKMNELMPNSRITESEFFVWQKVFKLAIDKALNKNSKCIIAAKDKKPCGIITFQTGENKYNLDCICTWPIEKGKKVILAGQTLLKQMFSDFLENKAILIDLSAIVNGPFDTVSIYSRLGFKQIGGENNLVAMRTDRERTEKVMEKLNSIIKTSSTSNKREIDLLKTLEL